VTRSPTSTPSTWSTSTAANSTQQSRTIASGWRVRAARWSIGARTMI